MAELNSLATLLADANLVSYWRMESGALTTDSKGSYTLTNNNTVGEVAGKYGGASNGGTSNTNKSLTVASDLGIGAGDITISFWVKLNAAIGSGAFWQFIKKGDSATHVSYSIGFFNNSGTKQLQFTRLRQGVSQDNIVYNFDLGTTDFHLITLTYNSTNLIGYIDGLAVGSPLACSGNGTSGNFDNTTILCDFDAGTNALNYYASASIDDVAIFNRALTDAEILSLYNPLALSNWFMFL